MADTKTTALTAATSWASGDLLYMVGDPAGTPVSRKITVDNIFATLNIVRGTNTVELRNGINPQAILINNTYTSGSVYERGFVRWVSNVLHFGTEHVGASLRPIQISAYSSTSSQCAFTNGTANNGLYWASNSLMFSALGAAAFGIRGSFITTRDTGVFCWTSGDAASGIDTALARTIAGVVGVTNGSTGGGALGLIEMTSPAAPATNGVYIFAEDNGAGKTRLMARFATGATQQLAIEP